MIRFQRAFRSSTCCSLMLGFLLGRDQPTRRWSCEILSKRRERFHRATAEASLPAPGVMRASRRRCASTTSAVGGRASCSSFGRTSSIGAGRYSRTAHAGVGAARSTSSAGVGRYVCVLISAFTTALAAAWFRGASSSIHASMTMSGISGLGQVATIGRRSIAGFRGGSCEFLPLLDERGGEAFEVVEPLLLGSGELRTGLPGFSSVLGDDLGPVVGTPRDAGGLLRPPAVVERPSEDGFDVTKGCLRVACGGECSEPFVGCGDAPVAALGHRLGWAFLGDDAASGKWRGRVRMSLPRSWPRRPLAFGSVGSPLGSLG